MCELCSGATEELVFHSPPHPHIRKGTQADFQAFMSLGVHTCETGNCHPGLLPIKGMPQSSNLCLISGYHSLASLPQPGGCPQRPSMWGLSISPDTGREDHQIDHPRVTTGNRNGNQAQSPVLSLPLVSTCLQCSSLAWCRGPACIVPRGRARPCFVLRACRPVCCYKAPAATCDQLTHGQRGAPGKNVLSCCHAPRRACLSLEPLS